MLVLFLMFLTYHRRHRHNAKAPTIKLVRHLIDLLRIDQFRAESVLEIPREYRGPYEGSAEGVDDLVTSYLRRTECAAGK